MDLHMPEMDGYEAIKRIKGQIKYHSQSILSLLNKLEKHKKLLTR